jgi:hypothetical protein
MNCSIAYFYDHVNNNFINHLIDVLMCFLVVLLLTFAVIYDLMKGFYHGRLINDFLTDLGFDDLLLTNDFSAELAHDL